MSDPLTYTFYGTTIPSLQKTVASAINILTTTQNERANAPEGKFPSEQDLLDQSFSDMQPLRMQPIFLTKFALVALEYLKLNGSTPIPELNPAFTSFADVIALLQKVQAVYDAVDASAFNEAAGKSVDIKFPNGKTLTMTGFADYYHSFAVPNAYFHLNAMYMALRGQGFALGKGVYIGAFTSEQQKKDWAPLKG